MRGKLERAREDGVITIPRNILSQIRSVTLAADVMFVNGAPFMVTISRKIRLRTAEHLSTLTVESLTNSLKRVINLYARGGYTVDLIMMDQEFEKLKDKLELIKVNTTAAQEQVGKIERSNCTVQERSRAICSLPPYSILPKQVVIHMVYFIVTFLNCDVT